VKPQGAGLLPFSRGQIQCPPPPVSSPHGHQILLLILSLQKIFSRCQARRAASPVSFLRAWRQVDLLLVLPLGLRVFLPGLLISVTAAEYSRPHRSAPSRNRPGFGSRSKSWSPRSQERALDFLSSFRSRFRCQSRSRGPVPDFAARLCPARNFSCRRAPVPWTCSLI
jgi:hypothetical protein